MKRLVNLAKNEQGWPGVSSSYFSIFSFLFFLFSFSSSLKKFSVSHF